MYDVTKLAAIKIGLASPEKIREWSHGEVTKPETINYRSQKPERDGLFCEKIFGPTKDFECFCGKYKKPRYQGLICEKCGVEITTKNVRRERMGHIELATPVTHIWYVKGIPSRIAQVLDITPKELEEVVYFVSHICVNTGNCELLTYREVFNEQSAKKCFASIIQNIKEQKDKKGYYVKCEALIRRISEQGDEVEESIYPDLLTAITNIKVDYDLSAILTSDVNFNKLVLGIKETENKDFLVMKLQEIMSAVDETGELTRCSNLIDRIKIQNEPLDFLTYSKFISDNTGAEFSIGAEAIQRLLKEVDINAEFEKVQKELKETQGAKNQKRQKLIKRLEVLEAFKQSTNQPEWMVLEVLPVIPPELRPMLPLDGGRYATSDLNELYRRVITRNTRLKRLLEIHAPSVILMNEKRMVQEAVDALIDNGRRGKAVCGVAGRPLKSLSHTLKGKQGRFRQNLLGKRVDYSGRSVIAVGPSLKMYQCGVPREMAVQLFKPFIASKMVKEGIVTVAKQANRKIDSGDPMAMRIVEELVKEHPVLLNRAPTLHRLGIQAFEVKLVEGKAIRLHPLVTTAFNADFDGDQMAIHVPLSDEAIEEARQLMLGSKNILGPKDGKPIVTPSQDMLLGNYYLTIENTIEDFLKQAEKYRQTNNQVKALEFENYARTEGKVYNDYAEVIFALENRDIHLHSRIAVRGKGLHKVGFTAEQNESYLATSVGKLIFNQMFPDNFPYLIVNQAENYDATPDRFFIRKGENIKERIAAMGTNPPFKKKDLGKIINETFSKCGKEDTAIMLDMLKDQGFKYSTESATTVSIADIPIYSEKKATIDKADKKVMEYFDMYERGLLTDSERHKLVCTVWKEAAGRSMGAGITSQLRADPTNPIFMMSDSGARGSESNFIQLCGMRGIMENPSGDEIEVPIRSSFREGLTVSEYFISSHGARKGGADTALKTAESGYLTRRLVDVAQDVVVREDDCGTDHGTIVKEIYDEKENKVIEPFINRIIGRYPLRDVYTPDGQQMLCSHDEMIDEAKAKAIVAADIEELEIRTIFGCQTKDGVCKKCYGRNMATGLQVEKGEAVGVMAAQSIGEPGTQLTMKNFHTGGVAGGEDITNGLPRVQELFEARNPKGEAIISEIAGNVESVTKDDNGRYTIRIKNELDEREYMTPFEARVLVKKEDKVENGQKITEGAINPKHLLEVSDVSRVQNYILTEVLKVYSANGSDISDKHLEIMIRQMFKRLLVIEGGDTGLLPGTKVDFFKFTEVNQKAFLEGRHPAVARPLVLGISKAALETDSFLAAASFQETTKVLTNAATNGKIDYLHGLKENVLVGRMIPAGTGVKEITVTHRYEDCYKQTEDEAYESELNSPVENS